jgi:hypothetical protein
MVLRSDEEANQAEIERDKRLRGNIAKGVKAAASIGAASVGGPLASKIMPFLNQYIPSSLAVKGISKVSPKLGSFLKKGQEMGLDIEEGLNFIKNEMSGEKAKENAKENRNIIEQYSPELHQFIDQEIKKGRKPIEAGAIAQNDKRFKNVIGKLMKDHKTPWSNILESVYGSSEMAQQPQNTSSEVQQQQPGQGQAALMAILQKIQQTRSGGQ